MLRFVADPLAEVRGWRWLTIKIGFSVWVRGFFTHGRVPRSLRGRLRPIYVNYLDYDVAAHAFGPGSRRALRSLRRVDRAIRQLWRVLRRVPEHQYDLYILADHGQAPARPYRDLTGGQRLERWIFDEFLDPAGAAERRGRPRFGLRERAPRTAARDAAGLFQHFLNYLDEDFLRRRDPEAYEQRRRARDRGRPQRLPLRPGCRGAARRRRRSSSASPGWPRSSREARASGFVLARSGGGPLCFWRGKRYQLGESEPGPFAGRPDAALVVQGIADLMAMPSAGDLVIYGIDAPEGHVSFIPEMGAHAGPSPEEMQTFIVRPAKRDPAVADQPSGPALRSLHPLSIRARGERVRHACAAGPKSSVRRDGDQSSRSRGSGWAWTRARRGPQARGRHRRHVAIARGGGGRASCGGAWTRRWPGCRRPGGRRCGSATWTGVTGPRSPGPCPDGGDRRLLEHASQYLRQRLVESGCVLKARDKEAHGEIVEMIRCPACGATNRVPQDKIVQGLEPVCGRCKTPLPVSTRR